MKHWIGIDVSKATLDVALLDEHGKVTAEEQVANTEKGLRSMWKRWTKAFGLAKGECLVCLEPTGHYSHLPLETLVQLEVLTWLAHPTDIIRSIGATRGKNDRIDALRIADYARRFHDKARLVTPDHLRTNKLKQLLTRRRTWCGARPCTTRIRNLNKCMDKSLQTAFTRIDKAQITALGKSIKQIEALITEVIAADAEHQRIYDLLLSIDGVGPVLAAHLLALTEGFLRFKTARELSCHAGCAPFEHSSGSSIRGKTRVSRQAQSTLKYLLHMAAVGVTARKGELQDYWKRKVAEGKHKMSVLNAIRNKLIHRIYAVIDRGTPFVRRTEPVTA
ncbi:MAG: IS110 family transposase [Flavobacteriales bacterium]|nr:IS110 family transposase [Flavobacteriales bacterium]